MKTEREEELRAKKSKDVAELIDLVDELRSSHEVEINRLRGQHVVEVDEIRRSYQQVVESLQGDLAVLKRTPRPEF